MSSVLGFALTSKTIRWLLRFYIVFTILISWTLTTLSASSNSCITFRQKLFFDSFPRVAADRVFLKYSSQLHSSPSYFSNQLHDQSSSSSRAFPSASPASSSPSLYNGPAVSNVSDHLNGIIADVSSSSDCLPPSRFFVPVTSFGDEQVAEVLEPELKNAKEEDAGAAQKSDTAALTPPTQPEEQPPIATFEEWTKQKLEMEMEKRRVVHQGIPTPSSNDNVVLVTPHHQSNNNKSPTPVPGDIQPPGRTNASPPGVVGPEVVVLHKVTPPRRNYASKECGAKILAANEEAENRASILNDKEKDDYMRNPCEQAKDKYVVIELCETIRPTLIELANFELFSSSAKDFRVLGSERYPSLEWTKLLELQAADTRQVQSFGVDSRGYVKFIRLELLSHYGKEHYCTLSAVRVYGISMVDEYEAEASAAAVIEQFQPPPTTHEEILQVDVTEVQNQESQREEQQNQDQAEDEHLTRTFLVDQEVEEEAEVQTPSTWKYQDCGQCGPSIYDTSILCHVFAPAHCSSVRLEGGDVHRPQPTGIPQGSAPRRHRSLTLAQARFIKSVQVQWPMCPKNAKPPPPASQNNSKTLPTPTPVIVPAPVIVTDPPQLAPDVPLPGGSTSPKESVFMKLNKRLTALELNMSLSSEYLSELSRRYVAHMEENKKEHEEAARALTDAVNKAVQAQSRQFGTQVDGLKKEVKDLETKVMKLLAVTGSVAERLQKEERQTTIPSPDYLGRLHNALVVQTCLDDGKRTRTTRSDEGVDQEYDDIVLDSSDGLWTTHQLVVIIVCLQLSTLAVVILVNFLWPRNRHLRPPTSAIDVQMMVEAEVERLFRLQNTTSHSRIVPSPESAISVENKLDIKQIKSEPVDPSSPITLSPPTTTPSSGGPTATTSSSSASLNNKKKRRQRRHKDSTTTPQNPKRPSAPGGEDLGVGSHHHHWDDSTSISSMSLDITETASTTSSEMPTLSQPMPTKKTSLTS